IFLFLSAIPDRALTQTVSFIARGDFKVGTHPHWMAASDFNGDGRPDLATANSDSNNVSVLLGNGDGTFQAAPTLVAGSRPESVAVGDIDRDGVPDLAVANSGSSDVSVLLGNGDGTFQEARSFDGGTTPAAVSVADLNGDGRPDLAVANFGSIGSTAQPGNAAVLLGNGDGSFQSAGFFVTGGTHPHAVAVSDIDGDGIPDLLVANSGSYTVAVLRGIGDGTFQQAR